MIGRVLNRAAAAAVLVALSLGVPAMLAFGIGWPLPSRLPSWDEVAVVLTSPPSQRLILNTVAVLCWILWAAFISSLAADLAWMARHGPRRPDRLTPARGLTFTLLAALLSGSFGATTAAAVVAPAPEVLVVAAPAAATATAPPATAAPTVVEQPVAPADPRGAGQQRRIALWEDAPTILPDPAASGPVLVQVGDDRHSVEVAPGDTLWDLADAWLGDPARWPEIHEVNRGRYPMHGGGHIKPDWVLVLPDDAAPPGTEPAGQPETADTADTEDPDGQPGLVHEVAKRDWMWHIADRYLADPQRYPEIAALNPELDARYDEYPDHIEPGDELLLPADADDRGPRHHATGDVTPVHEPPASAPPEPEPSAPPPEAPDRSTGSPTPQPSPPSPVTPTDPDGVVPDPAATPTPTPGPTSPTPEPTTSPTPSADPSPGAAGDADDDQPAADDGDGVVLGDGSWIPWAVAAAVAAAMAVVWLQRRRRYRPRRLDEGDELFLEEDPDSAAFDEPATVSRIRRALRLRSRVDIPHTALEPEPDEPAPAPGPEPESESEVAQPVASAGAGHDQQRLVAAVEPLPEGGIGIVGPGAEAAARGALVAALSAGAPVDPDAQTEVVVPAEVMVTLLGADAVTLGSWRRLRVTPDLDSALAVVEARLLATARLLDEYELEDLAALRAAAPAERPVPPLLLIAAAPQAALRMRTRNALGLGRGVGVSALLIGSWGHGPTVQVEVDGTCRPTTGSSGDLPAGIPARMAVVDQQTAFELLQTLREAHTGQAAPPAAPGPTPAPAATEPPATTGHGDAAVRNEKKTPFGRDDAQPPVPEPAPAPSEDGEEAGQEEPPAEVPTARTRVLGIPEIEGWQKAGRPLRKAAVELLVYLAVHPDGAAPEQIQETIWPDSRRRLAATKLHTAASNLRHLLAAAAGADDEHAGAYLRKEKGRYRLPARPVVAIDLWTLHAECDRARRATDPAERVAALRRAVAAYRGELAAGRDYEWITTHREAARMLALDAHTSLADQLADTDPPEAARLWLRATEIDPMAESVCQQAMRACRRIGDADTIRTLLRRLATNLDEIGAEPAEATIELAERLRTDVGRPGSGA